MLGVQMFTRNERKSQQTLEITSIDIEEQVDPFVSIHYNVPCVQCQRNGNISELNAMGYLKCFKSNFRVKVFTSFIQVSFFRGVQSKFQNP